MKIDNEGKPTLSFKPVRVINFSTTVKNLPFAGDSLEIKDIEEGKNYNFDFTIKDIQNLQNDGLKKKFRIEDENEIREYLIKITWE